MSLIQVYCDPRKLLAIYRPNLVVDRHEDEQVRGSLKYC